MDTSRSYAEKRIWGTEKHIEILSIYENWHGPLILDRHKGGKKKIIFLNYHPISARPWSCSTSTGHQRTGYGPAFRRTEKECRPRPLKTELRSRASDIFVRQKFKGFQPIVWQDFVTTFRLQKSAV
jgi:hypothetical protein